MNSNISDLTSLENQVKKNYWADLKPFRCCSDVFNVKNTIHYLSFFSVSLLFFFFRQQVCELKSEGEKGKKERGYSTKKRPRSNQK